MNFIRRLINSSSRILFKKRVSGIEFSTSHPHVSQNIVLHSLILGGRNTEWGKLYQFDKIKSYSDFCKLVPLQDYDSLKPFIFKMMRGDRNILWSEKINWFAKSSGTTSDQSKFIPVSKTNLLECHLKGGRDALALYYQNHPESKIMQNYSMIMGGSLLPFSENPSSIVGDVSAIMLHHLPTIGRPFFVPDIATALLADWDIKIEKFVKVALENPKIAMIAGVPTWTVVLFRKILEASGKRNMLEVWPDFEVYFHGGVSFSPYKEQFQKFFPSPKVSYRQVYNASEGYFAVQDQSERDDMLLLLSNGIFYEFLPYSNEDNNNSSPIPLEKVQTGVQYTMVISTNSGLWRYIIGDTVVFTSTIPYRIKITGRTKQFINAFGEEVIIDNADKALELSCEQTNAIVREYTVAPQYFGEQTKACHQWFIEFEKPPLDLGVFSQLLDSHLRSINSDYDAKRFKDMALEPLIVETLPPGTFESWMKYRGKFGGQNKVPRLANNRIYVEDLLKFKSTLMS